MPILFNLSKSEHIYPVVAITGVVQGSVNGNSKILACVRKIPDHKVPRELDVIVDDSGSETKSD